MFFRLFCSLLEHIHGLGQRRRDGHAHEPGILDDADGLVAHKGDHHCVPDEGAPDDRIQTAGHQHHQQAHALAAQTLPACPALKGSSFGLGTGVEHPRHDQAGDVVDRHKDDKRLQRRVPAAQQAGNGPTHNADGRTNLIFHCHSPFTLPSPLRWMMAA